MRENKRDIDVKRGEIIRCFLEEGMEKTLENYKESLPHENLLMDIIKSHYDFKKEGKKGKTDLEHFEDVVRAMNNLLNNKDHEVIDLSGSRNSIATGSKGYKDLKTIIENKNLKEDKDLLLYTALYHDIGKAIIRPRHGPEGADIIKDSGLADRKKFYTLGFKRPDFFFMSDLIRFHDYLAMIGTGEVSYLIFAEVLYPISNVSLFSAKYAGRFLDYLLLLNLADIAGSIEGKVSSEDFSVLMHDFKVIESAHDNISKKVYEDIFKEKPPDDDKMKVHKETIPARDHIDILSELQRLAENHTSERLRRLLRTGFKDLIKQDEKIKSSSGYKKWIENKYEEGPEGYLKPLDEWFIRDYENGINDMIPIIASLRGINVKQEFYTRFAFICKLDYMLGFIRKLFEKVIEIEIKKKEEERKSPHDLRRDLAMTLVELINTLVELFGDFTSNNTKIGLGFERFKEMYNPQKDKMLERLAGEKGNFKEAEALTKLRNSVVLWVITP